MGRYDLSKATFPFSAESRPSVVLGRSPDSEGAANMPRAASPSPVSRVAFEAAPSLTVAGPRRIRTGFPVRPVNGHPEPSAYHDVLYIFFASGVRFGHNREDR